MLAFVQFPIADLRGFSAASSARLTRPDWPLRTGIGNQSFIRGFGPAQRRKRGADYAWLDEQTYCNAARALRFEGLPTMGRVFPERVRCAFRRLFFDGTAVARVETGLSYTWMSERHRYDGWDESAPGGDERDGFDDDIDPFDVLGRIVQTPTFVPDGLGAPGRTARPLIRQGKRLAQLYAEATTAHTGTPDSDPGKALVSAGSPLVIIECQSRRIGELDPSFTRVDPDTIGGVDLAFGWRNTPSGDLGVWLAGYRHADFKALRSFRLCLARLHAEQEVLQSALSKIDNGTLVFQPGTLEGDRLEKYLNTAIRAINKDKWAGIKQSRIQQVFAAAEGTPRHQRTGLLRERLAGAREQIIRKVERFERMSQTIINVENVDMSKSVIIGDGNTINAPITIADTIQGSFNTVQASGVDDEVKQTLQQLLKDITAAAEQMPEKEAKTLAREADDLVNEVDSEEPRWHKLEFNIETIKGFAKKAGEVGEPILKTAGKLLPLLLALFP